VSVWIVERPFLFGISLKRKVIAHLRGEYSLVHAPLNVFVLTRRNIRV
jgi:hypothetical protein